MAEKAAEEKRRAQAGLQKERLLLEKKAKRKQAEADKQVGRGCLLSCAAAAPLQPPIA